MAGVLAQARFIIGALALIVVVAMAAPASAQQQPQTPRELNPTASSVQEDQLLRQMRIIDGRVSIPDAKSGNLEQPAGRDWREFHQKTLPWIAAIAILGMLAVLVVFYLTRGMVKIERGRSGRTVVRFNALERFVHWMTATCFIILALSRPQHHVRQAAAGADLRPRRVRGVVAMGQIRAQLSQLPVHHRCGADPAAVDHRQHPEQGGRGVGQARRRHHRQRSSAGRRASTPARR